MYDANDGAISGKVGQGWWWKARCGVVETGMVTVAMLVVMMVMKIWWL